MANESYDVHVCMVDYRYQYEDSKGEKQNRHVMLDENDDIWVKYRHKHIAEAQQELGRAFNAFVEQNKEISSLTRKDGKNKAKTTDTKQISAMIHKLPQYQDTLSKYSLHLGMMRELMNRFKQQRLDRLALWEQNMAMGSDPDGRELKNLLTSLSPILADDSVSSENKLRLMVTYIVTQGGLNDDKRSKVEQLAKLDSDERRIINNLVHLGVQLSKGKGGLSSLFKKLSGKKKQGEVDYHLSRYTPKVKEVAEEILKNTLSTTEYPFVVPPPSSFRLLEGGGGKRGSISAAPGSRTSNAGSLRSKSGAPQSLRSRGSVPAWLAAKRDDTDDNGSSSSITPSTPDIDRLKSGKKLYIFIIGGVTLSETRAAYEMELDHGLEVNVGGTSVITPVRFMEKLRTLTPQSSRYSLDL